MSTKLMHMTFDTDMMSASEIQTELEKKQGKLKAGSGITISADGTISSTAIPPTNLVSTAVLNTELGKKQDKLTAGPGIHIDDKGIISSTGGGGDVTSDAFQNELSKKQDKLTPGNGITISPDGKISATDSKLASFLDIEVVEAYWDDATDSFYSSENYTAATLITPRHGVVYSDILSGITKVLSSDGGGFRNFALVTAKYVDSKIESVLIEITKAKDSLDQILA